MKFSACIHNAKIKNGIKYQAFVMQGYIYIYIYVICAGW